MKLKSFNGAGYFYTQMNLKHILNNHPKNGPLLMRKKWKKTSKNSRKI